MPLNDIIANSKLEKGFSKAGFNRSSNTLLFSGFSFIFIALSAVIAASFVTSQSSALFIGVAAALGAYMALNIGANDVANNVGPAVGAKALTMIGALVMAAVFESAGAILAGGDVVNTISKGIIDPAMVSSPQTFIWLMMAALVSAALWVNLATWLGAPVSTTHSIVGGVAGAGIAAAGFTSVDWGELGRIAASWVISPVLGGILAALVLALIHKVIVYQDNKIIAARRWVPILIAMMATAFGAYLAIKGVKKIHSFDFMESIIIGLVMGGLAWLISLPLIRRQSRGIPNTNESLNTLFKYPLIISAALLCFAHGANDVANAIGPLAAIVSTLQSGIIQAQVSIPFWVMLIGAFGISFGLILFGPKLVRMVGQQITKLNPMRAFCVALSAATTVIIASWLALPVSSTHIALGGVFGVGFFREWYNAHSKTRKAYIRRNSGRTPEPHERVESNPDIRKRRFLVRRQNFMTIITAWVITVPSAALLSATVFFTLSSIWG